MSRHVTAPALKKIKDIYIYKQEKIDEKRQEKGKKKTANV